MALRKLFRVIPLCKKQNKRNLKTATTTTTKKNKTKQGKTNKNEQTKPKRFYPAYPFHYVGISQER